MRALLLSLVVVAAAACGGEASSVGLDEPLRVVGGAFKPGAFPSAGSAAVSGDAGAGSGKLEVTEVESASAPAHAGQTGKSINGRVTDDAYSIAVRFADLGSGYWVLPVGAPDLSYPGELTWRLPIELSPDLPAGNHTLQLVAIDAQGHGGPRHDVALCVLPPFDSSLNACDSTQPPAAAIISLTWDVDSDLDLVVKTPGGKLVDAKHPATAADPAHPGAHAPGVGVLDGDSNAGCHIDSIRREDLIFEVSPEHGPYQVYANLFNACGKPTTHFKVSAYARARGDKPGTYRLISIAEPSYGVVLGASANGGAKTGLYVTTIEFP
jgi:hypothetical protein